MASAWLLMCQPSASSAIELNHQPAAISATIATSVNHSTKRVPRSPAALPVWNTCSWRQRAWSWVCMAAFCAAAQAPCCRRTALGVLPCQRRKLRLKLRVSW